MLSKYWYIYKEYMGVYLRGGFFVMAMVFLPVFALGMGLLLAARQAKKDLAHLED